MIGKLKTLLFPPRCALCGTPIREGEEVGPLCREQVVLNTAPPRLDANGAFDGATAGLWYEDSVRRAIHGLKYYEKQNYARPLARVMEYALRHKLGEEIDLITFVPTNRKTKRRRGYNQAELLARELAKRCGVPCVAALEKTRETHAMHDLTPAMRRENVKDAFCLCCTPETVKGKRVLVADDVLTTGATLSACAAVLKKAGAERVFGLCAAATRRKLSRPLAYLEKEETDAKL
ncbi:MAG: ComF family protein [Clostridia bacterium]|nr:ComF family protein [Clostridia bacterium]